MGASRYPFVPGSDLPVVFAGDVAQLGHQVAPLLGQVKCVEASVCVVAVPGDVPAGLKFVDEGHDPAGQQVECGAEFLLAHAGG